MPLPNDLSTILDRIKNGEQTEADMTALHQLLSADDAASEGLRQRQIAVQLGKYNVNIGQGQDIQIGDRIYYEWNDKAIQKLVEVIQEQSDSIPLLPKELPQEDYIRLKNLLAAGRWREANEATRTVILKAVSRENEGWLADEQIQNFPYQVLRIVDRLWVQYSNQRFGFSVQKRICDECEKEPQAFGDRVGWRIQDSWISASQVIYIPANAPDGHLPWGIMQVITMDNAALDAFVYGLRAVTKTVARHDWQKQLLADFMAVGGFFIGDRIDKEEFKRNLEYELSHDEPWWEGQRLEESKVRKLFSLLVACPNL
ncbi:GUN4 domain-containing protein [Coleofasciculus sp. E2-BRE-01]|uniref:GUN4 domain-containing protein n=1 Tax=Coleofasciculus sp. E2-BRE-01 TaxID=3069524 RepID=UPI0033052467